MLRKLIMMHLESKAAPNELKSVSGQQPRVTLIMGMLPVRKIRLKWLGISAQS
jgi:hypothetical protein